MDEKWQAVPGVGIGSIRFGISREALLDMLGEPDDIDTNEEDGESCEHYYYDDLDVSFTFSDAEGDRLLLITIGNPVYSIGGKLSAGMERPDALEAIRELGWEDPMIEDVSDKENPRAFIYSYDDQGLDVWFDDDIITGLQMSPLWKDDDTIAWPDIT